MFYRESGQFKASYAADQAVFPIRQDQYGIAAILLVAFFVIPYMGDEYFFQAIMVPVLIFSLAAIGLNILTGYCGQLSLGTGGFMAVGAVACYKLTTAFPELNFIIVLLLSGVITAMVGLLFGIPSLRIKGFYLAVATLAAQFFLSWLFNKVAWFQNYAPSGTITMPPREVFGVLVTGAASNAMHRYLFCLIFVIVLAMAAKNLVRGPIGRSWMAIRDMDIAAELIGFRPFQTKLLAFSVSSFYVGVAGAMALSLWLGSVETAEAFDINVSFQVLFMIIIGGLGSMMGSFLGAAFIILTPIVLTNVMVGSLGFQAVTAKHFEFMFFGGMIIMFLIVEPQGLARLWQILKEKLRLWPFPY
ncbi:MAG: branched-chain amino acid ABC transporter permease [Rhodospirillaceae bacterium]|jgi:branched-chain amino acid transport system permease protein|nr:branched-chain amino acid ABC transporter permease [Rhodospirillaceae bacterium]MBT6138990.1 branched-chain amino acid ABC transporter permease [Rhodospirillaceae bacterium]